MNTLSMQRVTCETQRVRTCTLIGDTEEFIYFSGKVQSAFIDKRESSYL